MHPGMEDEDTQQTHVHTDTAEHNKHAANLQSHQNVTEKVIKCKCMRGAQKWGVLYNANSHCRLLKSWQPEWSTDVKYY